MSSPIVARGHALRLALMLIRYLDVEATTIYLIRIIELDYAQSPLFEWREGPMISISVRRDAISARIMPRAATRIADIFQVTRRQLSALAQYRRLPIWSGLLMILRHRRRSPNRKLAT